MSENAYNPNIGIHPGETLEDTISALKMTQAELAERTGLTKKTINEIVQGKNPITPDSAVKLGAVFGTSPTFWNNLQRRYEETLVRLKAENELEEELSLVSNFKCYNELAKWDYVKKTRIFKERVLNLLNFFGISSLKLVPKIHAIAFRQTKQKNVAKESLAAWLRCGEIDAQKKKVEKFNKEKAINSIDRLRALTMEVTEKLSKELKDICASFGIAVVFVPYFKNTHVNGATKWLNTDNALIQLSLRGKRDDIFWFTFFHELAHVLKHGKKEQFVEFDYENENSSREKEEEADEFARNTLIPKN
ncbi:MAG: HigA family addiction module antidote protein, partial [Candidatus Omnitrophica bacterium]|nr:HigA family addiction module antidote protein [Candidatus Omnitrophota bacterium]